MRQVFRIVCILLCLTQQTRAENELKLLTWNVESGGNSPAVIADQLAQLVGYDIYGLAEVHPSNSRRYTKSLGDRFKSVLSVTGNRDRLLLIYDIKKLELLESQDLDSYSGVRMNDANLRQRSPLVGRFKLRGTDSEFIVVMNHLACEDAELRKQQAKGLRLWCEDQTLPVIGIGDYNFDFDFKTRRGNAAFDEHMLDYRWRWVQPTPLIDTNWADRDGDGNDDYPDSCLDFTFVGAGAYNSHAKSRVIVRDGDFPDDERTSDHRPVELRVPLH